MSYKGLIIKLQRLYAHYDEARHKNYISLSTKKGYDLICKEIDNMLKSEKYGMKKHFKY